MRFHAAFRIVGQILMWELWRSRIEDEEVPTR